MTNFLPIVLQLSRESVLTQVELANALGMTKQTLNGVLHQRTRNEVKMNKALEMLEPLGYELVVVPKGKKLPEGSIKVESTEQAE